MRDAGTRRTRRQLTTLGVAFAVCTFLVAVVAERRTPGAGAPWGAVSAAGVLGVVGFARRHAHRNRPSERGRVFDSLGAANAVTLCRGVVVAFLAGVLVVPAPVGWLPALLYGAVAASDPVDGAIARLRDRTTLLGARLDVNVDAAGLLVAALVGVSVGSLPPWYLAVGAARYLFVLGAWRRRRRGLPVFELPHGDTRRALAGIQMAVTAVALAPVVPQWAGWTLATVTMLPFLGNFLVDWFVVTGRRERPLP
ncbi:CDP-alcohol phosphatidyltransferase family protein [Halogeometricum limi]|uniref:CDP-diacylglycerol--glycerol-3-phosphate 3-phosphatidyltransferase n=1 Tax=Halogeometricum limi TaxID=555875 RepID=A0A1I6FSS2_9EURY|nr:CDP-alcohol phosphatidyltransferase family protein [Halogeometricum limi]SFR33002.1 CDP-diacylglycerol--glycerol-3-phosphate 3-phosphatidyltransferase [Halogeometricum limi]